MTGARLVELGQLRVNFSNAMKGMESISVSDGNVAELLNKLNHLCFGPLKLIIDELNVFKEGNIPDEKMKIDELENEIFQVANAQHERIKKILANEEKYISTLVSSDLALTHEDVSNLNKRIGYSIVLLGVLRDMNIGMPSSTEMIDRLNALDKKLEIKLRESIDQNANKIAAQSKKLVESKKVRSGGVKDRMLKAQTLLETVKSETNEVKLLQNELGMIVARIGENAGPSQEGGLQPTYLGAVYKYEKAAKEYEHLIDKMMLVGVEKDAGFKNTVSIITGLMQLHEELSKSTPNAGAITAIYTQVMSRFDAMRGFYLLGENLKEHQEIISQCKEELTVFKDMDSGVVSNEDKNEGLVAISKLFMTIYMQDKMAPQFLKIALERGDSLNQADIFRLLFQNKIATSAVMNMLGFSVDGTPISPDLWSKLLEGEHGKQMVQDAKSCLNEDGKLNEEVWTKFLVKYQASAAEGAPERFVQKFNEALLQYENFKNSRLAEKQNQSPPQKLSSRLALSRTLSSIRPRSGSIQNRSPQDSVELSRSRADSGVKPVDREMAMSDRRLSQVSFTADQLNKIVEMQENEKNQDKNVAAEVKQILSSQSGKSTPEETQARLVQAETLRDNVRIYITYLQTLPVKDEFQTKIKELSANSHLLNTHIYNLTHPKLERQSSGDRPAAQSAPARVEQTENSPEAGRFSPADLASKYRGVGSVAAMLTKPESVSRATIEKALSLHQELVTYFNEFIKEEPDAKEMSKATTVLIELKTVKSTYDRAAKQGIKHADEEVKPALVGSHRKAPSS